MNGITIPMAIVDFIPVALFFAAAVILQRDLYNKMVKGAFALLTAGSIMVLIAGIYKATWKILYALGVCDFQALDIAFFPLQGPGFVLVFLSMIGLFSKYNKEKAVLRSVAPVPLFLSNMPFVVLQIIGCAGAQWSLFAISMRMKKRMAGVLFVVSFVFMLGMGYLSSQFDDSSSMNWLAQCVNIVSQGALLLGVVLLHKAGLGEKDALKRKAA